MLNDIIVNQLNVQGFKVVEAVNYFENGQTLFKGLYNIQFQNDTVLRVRENNGLYSIHTIVKYPTMISKKDQLSSVELIDLLMDIKKDILTNEKKKAIINVLTKHAERGASAEHLESKINRLINVWKNNRYLTDFIKSIDVNKLIKTAI